MSKYKVKNPRRVVVHYSSRLCFMERTWEGICFHCWSKLWCLNPIGILLFLWTQMLVCRYIVWGSLLEWFPQSFMVRLRMIPKSSLIRFISFWWSVELDFWKRCSVTSELKSFSHIWFNKCKEIKKNSTHGFPLELK